MRVVSNERSKRDNSFYVVNTGQSAGRTYTRPSPGPPNSAIVRGMAPVAFKWRMKTHFGHRLGLEPATIKSVGGR